MCSFVVTVTATHRSLGARPRWPRDRPDSKSLLTFNRSGAPTGVVSSSNDCFPRLPIHALGPIAVVQARVIAPTDDPGVGHLQASGSYCGGGEFDSSRATPCKFRQEWSRPRSYLFFGDVAGHFR
jgi:hypothetical protein